MVPNYDAPDRTIFAAWQALDFHRKDFYSVLTGGPAKRLDIR